MEAVKPGWIISNVVFALHLPREASETQRAKAQNPTQLPDEYLPSLTPFPLALSNPWKSNSLRSPSTDDNDIEVM